MEYHHGFPEIKAIFLGQFHTYLGPVMRLSFPGDAVETGEQPKYYGGDVRSIHQNKSDAARDNKQPVNGGSIDLIKHRMNPLSITTRKFQDNSSGDKVDFDSIQTLVIPKLTLFERLITIDTGNYKVMCYPVAITGNYARNIFIFNMCFAFNINDDVKCYGPVVRRVGCLLKELEISNQLVSNPEGEQSLRTMMQQLLTKLNAHGEYQIELDMKGLAPSVAATGISIKLFPFYENPKDIEPYHVPILTIDFELAKLKSAQSGSNLDENKESDVTWDLVLDRVMQFMDNVNTVQRIAQLTNIREGTVISALKHLDYYGCISLVDIFQFGNVYETQCGIMDMYRSAWLQRECHSYVTQDGRASDIQLEELMNLYLTVRKRQTIAEWIVENDVDAERLDVRRFVIFGVVHKLLRRIHCYPVLCEPPLPLPKQTDGIQTSTKGSEEDGGSVNVLSEQMLGILDGTHHMDELSVVEDISTVSLRELLDKHGNVEYMYF